ncbi:MAG: acetolactate synthase [Synergistaceae bacterium]|nr:acetolactate synthase [Synergistaceae bacterium]
MSVRQISVFLENRPGCLHEMTRVLAENNIDMRGLSLAETSDFGIVRLIVNNVLNTATVLKDAGFVNNLTPVLAVEVSNAPGGLCKALDALNEADINVEYMYAITLSGGENGKAYMILRVSDDAKAETALRGAGVRLVDQEELAKL